MPSFKDNVLVAVTNTPGVGAVTVGAAARDQAWRAQIDNLTHAFGQALQALKQPAPRGKVQQFNVTYDAKGRVDVVVPTYEK